MVEGLKRSRDKWCMVCI